MVTGMAAVEQYSPAEASCLGRGFEAAFDDDALGMIGAKPRIGAKYFGQCVNELFLERLVLCGGNSTPMSIRAQ